MTTIRDPDTPTNIAKVDENFRALRVTQFPLDLLGRYHVHEMTGLMTGIAALGEIFQFRWTDADNLALIKFLRVSYSVVTGFTAAQELAFRADKVTAWSVVGSGGTAIVPGAANLKRRTSYPLSKVGDMRISTTGALTAGTKTFNTNPLLAGVRKTMAAAATVQDSDFAAEVNFDFEGGPLILAQNEGLVVRNVIAMGAAGTIRGSVAVGWEEAPAASWPTL